MGQRYPDFSRNRLRGHSPGRRPRPSHSNFAVQLIVYTFVAAFIGWNAAPGVQAFYASTTSTPEENAARERTVYYRGCNDARAAGAAPIYAGQPGYRREMDGDNDGIACEPYR